MHNGKIRINEVKTKYIFKIVNGATPSSSNTEYWDGNITWITPADMSKCISNTIMNSDRKITEEGLNSCGTSLVPTGSIILSTRAPIGSVCIAGVELCTNQGCKALVAKDNVNVRFYFYYLLISTELLNSLGRGTTFLELSGSELGNFLLPFPKKAKQDEIANYLDQKCTEIDRVAAAKQKQNELLKEYKQSIIYEAVTKGLDKTVRYKDSGIEWIGKIPEDWEEWKIKYVCEVDKNRLSENTDADYLFKYIDISSVTEMGGIGETVEMTFDTSPSRARMIVSKGDTIISTVRTYLKAIAFIEESNKYICSTGFAVLTPKKRLLPRFLFYQTQSEYFIQEVVSRSVGVSYPAITSSALSNISFFVPPFPTQQHIADYLDQKCSEIDRIIKSNDDIITKLKEYRQSVIYEAVTGKIEL